MNERIKELAELSGFKVNWQHEDVQARKMARFEKFAQLIVQECAQVNKQQSYELMGVIADVENGNVFDDVCLTSVKQVEQYLNDLLQHFGVEQ